MVKLRSRRSKYEGRTLTSDCWIIGEHPPTRIPRAIRYKICAKMRQYLSIHATPRQVGVPAIRLLGCYGGGVGRGCVWSEGEIAGH